LPQYCLGNNPIHQKVPEIYNGHKIFSLLEFTQSIERAINSAYSKGFWISAEMAKVNHYPASGHAYPTLIQKNDNKIEAQIQAVIWKVDYQRISQKFLNDISEPLKDGTKILFFGKLRYSPGNGLKIIIEDIDTTYTKGYLENEKQKAIKKLQAEGIFDFNKRVSVPILQKNIAIVSVQTGEGYRDFMNQINNNKNGYSFFTMLFESRVEGDKMVTEMKKQLSRIKKVAHHFDIVAIIRGGGGEVGLSVFNNYELAAEVAKFPIPVFTGIGHVSHNHVIDMVSAKSFINPTEMAVYIIQNFETFDEKINVLNQKFVQSSRNYIDRNKNLLNQKSSEFKLRAENYLQMHTNGLRIKQFQLHQNYNNRIQFYKTALNHSRSNLNVYAVTHSTHEKQKISSIQKELKLIALQKIQAYNQNLIQKENNVKNLDPKNVLKRGYSITRIKDKAIKDIKTVAAGTRVKTILYHGEFESEVIKIKD